MRASSDVVLPGCKITWKASVPVLLPCEQQVARIMAQTRTDRTVVPVDSWVLLCPLRLDRSRNCGPDQPELAEIKPSTQACVRFAGFCPFRGSLLQLMAACFAEMLLVLSPWQDTRYQRLLHSRPGCLSGGTDVGVRVHAVTT